ncbi:MAG: response regulator [Microbacteriaceae bacterium]|nr:response regulator [Burkholderiaceae bacterium]
MKEMSAVLNILYVEDNNDIREMVVELLENPERRIVACADAEAAWQHLQREPVDVLITDVNLPGWTGTELARRWLESDARRWVILFSGYDFKSTLISLGPNVRALPKEDFDRLDRLLVEIDRARQTGPLGDR